MAWGAVGRNARKAKAAETQIEIRKEQYGRTSLLGWEWTWLWAKRVIGVLLSIGFFVLLITFFMHFAPDEWTVKQSFNDNAFFQVFEESVFSKPVKFVEEVAPEETESARGIFAVLGDFLTRGITNQESYLTEKKIQNSNINSVQLVNSILIGRVAPRSSVYVPGEEVILEGEIVTENLPKDTKVFISCEADLNRKETVEGVSDEEFIEFSKNSGKDSRFVTCKFPGGFEYEQGNLYKNSKLTATYDTTAESFWKIYTVIPDLDQSLITGLLTLILTK